MARQRKTTVWRVDEIESENARYVRAHEDVDRILGGLHRERNPIKQRSILLRASQVFIERIQKLQEINESLTEMSLLEPANSGLPWTSEEDDLLVQMAADGESMHEIAGSLLRTPAACATRLSQLVGIPRGKFVEGYIDGTIGTAEIRGMFKGTLSAN